MAEPEPLMEPVTGPRRSGTGDEPTEIATNVRAMNEVARDVFREEDPPVTGD